jgi:hypothetical protein
LVAIVACNSGIGRSQTKAWLDESKPASWNNPGLTIPAAPAVQDVNPRCREFGRPPELEQDKRVQDRGWRLDGSYQGGWEVVVIRGTASYDGMCRPWQFQGFVFVRGVFAGTLSPKPMDSRTDGALVRVFLTSKDRLTAQYQRYAPNDPACCPTSTTNVEFEIVGKESIVRPLSASKSPN